MILQAGVEELIIFRSMCIWARLSLVLPKQWRFEKNMLFFICTKIDVKAISANFVCSVCSRIKSLFAAKYEWNDVSMKSFHYYSTSQNTNHCVSLTSMHLFNRHSPSPPFPFCYCHRRQIYLQEPKNQTRKQTKNQRTKRACNKRNEQGRRTNKQTNERTNERKQKQTIDNQDR